MKIKLGDKTFLPYLEHAVIQDRILQMAEQIDSQYASAEQVHFIVVLKGAMIFASDLIRQVRKKSKLSFIKVSSYKGVKSTGEVKLSLDIEHSWKNEHIIIIEDIIDTGQTILFLKQHLLKQKPASISICTLLLKPEVFKQQVPIDYAGFEIPNDFVVGYGMDYNELGRSLKDIYVLSSEQ